jgi:hypothetical protein
LAFQVAVFPALLCSALPCLLLTFVSLDWFSEFRSALLCPAMFVLVKLLCMSIGFLGFLLCSALVSLNTTLAQRGRLGLYLFLLSALLFRVFALEQDSAAPAAKKRGRSQGRASMGDEALALPGLARQGLSALF